MRSPAKPSGLLRDRRVWLVLGAAAMIGAMHAAGLHNHLTLDTLRAHHRELMEFVGGNLLLSVAIYAVAYVVIVGLSLPGALCLTLTGGFLFGPVIGTLVTIVAATIGATLVFLFARTVFAGSSLDRFGPQARSLAQNICRNAWSYLLALRLVPLFPFVLVNIIPAFVNVRASTFVLTTLIGIVPATAVFSLAGAGFGATLDRGEGLSLSAILTPEILLALAGLGLLALAGIPLRRWLERKTAQAPSAPEC